MFKQFLQKNISRKYNKGLPQLSSHGFSLRIERLASSKRSASRGFTLIELLVSIAIFSIVLIMVLTAITTILDANRKARSVATITNELYFAVESMTRDIKSGVRPRLATANNGDNVGCRIDRTNANRLFAVDQIEDTNDFSFDREVVYYCLKDGRIQRKVGGNAGRWEDITPPNVTITRLEFIIRDTQVYNQPFTIILVGGQINVANNLGSEFNIQTSVSQRKLNIGN